MSESDGVDEALQASLRTTMTAAARVGETLARVRQQHRQRAAAISETRARELTARLQGEMLAARTAYRGVDDPGWWATARGDDIAAAYQTATAWRDVDPAAERAERRIAEETRVRYDVDVRQLDPGTVGPQLNDAATQLAHRETLDVAESSTLLSVADRADQQAAGAAAERERLREAVLDGDLTPHEAAAAWPEQDQGKDLVAGAAEELGCGRSETGPTVAWDSAGRREVTARELAERVKDPEAVEAVMRADVAQAKPAADATRGGSAGAKGRSGRAAGAGRQREQQRGLTR